MTVEQVVCRMQDKSVRAKFKMLTVELNQVNIITKSKVQKKSMLKNLKCGMIVNPKLKL